MVKDNDYVGNKGVIRYLKGLLDKDNRRQEALRVRKILERKPLTISQERELKAMITIGAVLEQIPKKKWEIVLQNAKQWAKRRKTKNLTNS